jgi:hypothetical protein
MATKVKKKAAKKVAVKGTTVRVAWNQEAVTIFEEKGWKALVKAGKTNSDLCFNEIVFDTPAEANAYDRGIAEANGWDDPTSQVV